MAELRWTVEALDWLEEIYRYIAKDNPGAAEKVVDGIYDRAQLLMQNPDLGVRFRQEKEGEVRFLLYGHYRIAYLRHVEGELIDIIGVFHSALDVERYLTRESLL